MAAFGRYVVLVGAFLASGLTLESADAQGPAPAEKPDGVWALYQSAQDSFREGMRLKSDKPPAAATKRFLAAVATLNKCIALDAAFPDCHMMLGSTYAELKQPDKAYEQYVIFVQLAPDHPKAEAVRRLIQLYEDNQRGK
jgi:tetratricopeptide (TPR) repeat protein